MKETLRDPTRENGADVTVVYVEKLLAKQVKTFLENNDRIHKDFRMVPGEGQWIGSIAIPVKKSSVELRKMEGVLGEGVAYCPFSTSLLGNHKGRTATASTTKDNNNPPSLVEQALIDTITEQKLKEFIDISSWLDSIRSLKPRICPKKLEYLGDDRTLVLSRSAFSLEEESFVSFLRLCGCEKVDQQEDFVSSLWKHLARVHKSPRLVRRGEVAPSSGIRESNYRLLWPFSGIPDTTGPGSPAWITVTEQQIRQSFDMTRVMFSRGNITEKIRFGKLVQKGDIVLDLYGGIGYFTLPALVHGEADYVYVCEWNPEAAKALRFNLSDNGVAERATVLEGDCRILAQQHKLVDMFDRVSLGLLPSSEGGWWTAVQALRKATGGWLHVHGNVPAKEVEVWTIWLCGCLFKMVQKLEHAPKHKWSVVCTHVEKVKSFAPTVNHYVADVFLGSPDSIGLESSVGPGCVGIIDKEGNATIVDVSTPLNIPSCALSEDGVLHQEWMR